VRVYGQEVIGRGIEATDPIKLVVDVHGLGLTGFAAATWLRQEYLLNPEFADLRRMVCSVTLGDDEHTVDALIQACAALAAHSSDAARPLAPPCSSAWPEALPPMRFTPREASRFGSVAVDIGDTAGRIAAEMVMPYPPGVPLFVPGELITTEALDALDQLSAAGCRLVGPSDPTASTLRCITDDGEPHHG
jgi:arginine/lysine/ornithine decarboxylase